MEFSPAYIAVVVLDRHIAAAHTAVAVEVVVESDSSFAAVERNLSGCIDPYPLYVVGSGSRPVGSGLPGP